MNTLTEVENKIPDIINNLKHITFEKLPNEYVASLVDSKGNKIVRGYGSTTIEAINNLHSNFL